MDTKNEERKIKMSRIIEEYDKRKTQKEVADKFGMEIKDVSRVTQENNYRHTRKITQENRKEDELINPCIKLDELSFLDKYSIENFEK